MSVDTKKFLFSMAAIVSTALVFICPGWWKYIFVIPPVAYMEWSLFSLYKMGTNEKERLINRTVVRLMSTIVIGGAVTFWLFKIDSVFAWPSLVGCLSNIYFIRQDFIKKRVSASL